MKSSRERLVNAAFALVAESGEVGCSARQVAKRSDAAASSINYTFGSVEHLLSCAYAQGAAHCETWLRQRRAALAALPASPAATAFVLESTIHDWTCRRRDLALVYQECRVAASPCLAGWTGAIRGFWHDVATALGLPSPAGALLHAMFEAEALYHLSQWDADLEAACLREACSYFVQQWLGIPGCPVMGATACAVERLQSQPPWTAGDVAVTIARAAADIVGTDGLASLTHRAVAVKAGMTLGAVTYHFPTVEALVAGAVRGQVLAQQSPLAPAETRKPLAGELKKASTRKAIFTITSARRKLFLAGIRRPDLAGACASIRFAHGGTARAIASEIEDLPIAQQCLHSGVLAKLVSGAGLLKVDGVDAAPPDLMDIIAEGFFPLR